MARSRSPRSRNLSFGIMLLAVGAILLATRFVAIESAPAWLLGLGAALALIAILQRAYAPLVAGMVLLGLGAGMLLGDREVARLPKASWTALALGISFVLIYCVAALLGLKRHWWPLLVGVVLAAVALARFYRRLLVVPPGVEIAVRTWWPAALVVVGLVLVVQALRK